MHNGDTSATCQGVWASHESFQAST